MIDARITKEGNLRFASLASTSWLCDPEPIYKQCLDALGEQQIDHYGPLTVIVDFPPLDNEPHTWHCQIGTAITGIARGGDGLLIEDYHNLQSLSIDHFASQRSIGDSYKQLQEQALSMGWKPRPYWRAQWHQDRTSDGNIFPHCRISLFVDR